MQEKLEKKIWKVAGGCLFATSILFFFLIIGSKNWHLSAVSPTTMSFRMGERRKGILEAETNSLRCNKIGENTICQHGVIKSGHKYAIYGSSLFNEESSINYCFDLPLSAMAWNRIGFDSIVYLIGDYQRCDKASRIRFIVEALMAQDYVVLLIIDRVRENNTVTVSQTLRLFAASFVQNVEEPKAWRETYIISADADIWPVDDRFFDLPPGKEILHGDLSGDPIPDVNKPTNAPLSYVGMRVRTWVEVLSFFGVYAMPTTTTSLIRYFSIVYGKSCCEGVRHGGQGWFIDQAMISRRIEEWKREKENGLEKIYIYQRNIFADRIDRIRWRPETLESIVDAHILQYAFKPDTWSLRRRLIVLLYDNNGTVSWCDRFADSVYKLNDTC